MTTAKVIWADGRETVEKVVGETETTFTTGDANRVRWSKRTGIRIGSLGYVKKAHRGRSFWAQATAQIIQAGREAVR